MKTPCVPFLVLFVLMLCTACEAADVELDRARKSSPPAPTEPGPKEQATDVDAGNSQAQESPPPATSEPNMKGQAGDTNVILEGWVAGDYYESKVVGKWVRVESTEGREVDYPGLPHYEPWGGYYVPVVARTCPVPDIDVLQVVKVAGQNIDQGFGIDICVPGGSMVVTGRTQEGDPSDFVHFLATFNKTELYNRESTILATAVKVLSGSPDYFSEVVRLRHSLSSSWAPAGESFEAGMTLEVFGWFEDPVAHGRPYAVFEAAFIIWDR
jgi:hypothetical protein